MAREYKKMEEKTPASKLLDSFPDIDAEACTREVNNLFTPYLFFHWGKGHAKIELWSSCCNQHGTMDNPPRTVTIAEQMILDGKHNGKAVCPWCGREVTLKETGRLGQKKALIEFHPVLILKARDGELYARAYWARKNYKEKLNDPPLFMLGNCYHFRIGMAEEVFQNYSGKWETEIVERNYDPVHRKISEPFIEGDWYFRYCSYNVIGLEEIGRSDFRYCQYEAFETGEGSERSNMIQYLTAASIYPKQIEMLMKSGYEEIVRDLIYRRRKNSRTFNWKETNYLKAFGLSRQELKAFQESEADWRLIAEYKMLRNKKLTTSFPELKEFNEVFGRRWKTGEALQSCRKWKVKPMKLFRYLSKYCGGCPAGRRDVIGVWEHWKDYTDMAADLEWDMKEETVLLPTDLYGKHDQAAKEKALKDQRVLAEQLEQERKTAHERIQAREEKYNFEMEGYFIQVAECAGDIIQEGKTLQHCVGGYAERHMAGVTTILFLRRKEAPRASLYTIEMNGNTLRQIHGFQNERGGAKDPRKTMAWMLDPWLEWLKAGSKRNKDGSPKLPKNRKKETNAA